MATRQTLHWGQNTLAGIGIGGVATNDKSKARIWKDNLLICKIFANLAVSFLVLER
jgi:hypothetical protein